MRAGANQCLEFLSLACGNLGIQLCFAGCCCGAMGGKKLTVVHGAGIITVDSEERIYVNGALAIEGDQIVAVGHSSSVLAEYSSRADEIIDFEGSWILPGTDLFASLVFSCNGNECAEGHCTHLLFSSVGRKLITYKSPQSFDSVADPEPCSLMRSSSRHTCNRCLFVNVVVV